MKAITKKERKEWSRAKVLKTSKNRFDMVVNYFKIGMSIDSEVYLHLKRMFLHDKEYKLINFDSNKRDELFCILDWIGMDYKLVENRYVLNMSKFYNMVG
jgi:hypothetical protein